MTAPKNKKLGFGKLKSTHFLQEPHNEIVAQLKGMFEDMLVEQRKSAMQVDSIILDFDVNFEISILLGELFLDFLGLVLIK